MSRGNPGPYTFKIQQSQLSGENHVAYYLGITGPVGDPNRDLPSTTLVAVCITYKTTPEQLEKTEFVFILIFFKSPSVRSPTGRSMECWHLHARKNNKPG